MQLYYLGWIREGFSRWIQPKAARGKTEAECISRLRKWIDEHDYRDPTGKEDCELVVLVAGTPPWIPLPKEKS